MQKAFVPNQQPLASRALYNARHYWRQMPTVLKMIILMILSVIVLGRLVAMLPTPAPMPANVEFDQFVLATVQLVGVLLKTLVMNAGTLAKPLVEPLLWISAFCWALLSIAGCFWAWRYMRNKLG